MGRTYSVLLVSVLLTGMLLSCVSMAQDERIELRPTLILTPYATATHTPAPLPSQTPVPTITATPDTNTYKVRAGDTLGGIAIKYGVSTRELMRLNELNDGDLITVGQELRVPKK